jgi:hypothetical protein
MRNLAISAAVIGVLASAGVSAKNVDIYVSGASAQRNFWRADLKNIANCATTTTFAWDGNATAPFSKPDLSFTTCTAGAAPIGPGIAAGDTVTLHYTAELGSVSGVTMALGKAGVPGYPTQQVFLQNGPGCNATTLKCDTGGPQFALYSPGPAFGGTCPAGDVGKIKFCGGNPAEIIQHTPDIDAMDIEPTKWANPDNWPNILLSVDGGDFPDPAQFAGYGPAPTPAQLALISTANGGGTLNGQLFAVITNGVPGGDPTNLSHASLQSIFQGAYTTWSQVPEVGPAKDPGNTQITVCRRDNGSGTQASASIYQTGTECGLPNFAQFVETDGVAVLINASTGSLKTCVNGHTGSIGMLSLTGNLPAGSDTFKIETIDGVEVNAHNAAAGYYPYAYETFGVNHSGSALAQTFLTRAKSQSALQAVLGTETVTEQTNHQFHVTAGTNPIGVYALPIAGNANSVTSLKASPAIPVAAGSKNGESCTVSVGSNSGT